MKLVSGASWFAASSVDLREPTLDLEAELRNARRG